ncbi:MAG: hypothetical protein HYZ54_11570 [Ignavibacteriae bacterium]|nr:hypothetical protein [Ignavibacteriota bacterium]
MAQTPKLDEKVFSHRIDFYWQAIAMYSIALVIYSFLRGTIAEGQLSITLKDPIVLLLGAFVVATGIGALISQYMKRKLIISDDAIIIRNRFREKIVNISQIQRIAFGREKRFERGAYRIIKIRIAGRRRLMRIRPSVYDNEPGLIAALLQLKRSIHHPGH